MVEIKIMNRKSMISNQMLLDDEYSSSYKDPKNPPFLQNNVWFSHFYEKNGQKQNFEQIVDEQDPNEPQLGFAWWILYEL